MFIKIASPMLIALGWLLYIALDSPNGDAVRWPAASLIAIGLLLIPIYHLFSFKNKRLGIQKPHNGLFKLSIILFVFAVLAYFAIFLYEGFDGFYWFYIAMISGGAGLIALIVSLFVSKN